MTSEEDMIRFHNGDTLGSIPVVRADEPRRRIPWRTITLTVGCAAFVGAVVGLSFGMGSRSQPVQAETPASSPAVTADAKAVSSPPVPVVTVTAQETVTVAPSEPDYDLNGAGAGPEMHGMEWEQIYLEREPATGGDPGVDYCLSYAGEFSGGMPSAVLLANAPAYQCSDFLFSTHPSDGSGVFEEMPPDCSATPGARTAELWPGPDSAVIGQVMYTCLLMNDGA